MGKLGLGLVAGYRGGVLVLEMCLWGILQRRARAISCADDVTRRRSTRALPTILMLRAARPQPMTTP